MNTNRKEHQDAGRQRISWGAVFAGLFGTLALLWLSLLLGSALGISVLDATDASVLDGGFGWAAVIWILASFLIAYLIGGAIAGRLSSEPTRGAGMLHGLTVWSTATVLWLVMGALGVGGAASLATHATGNVAESTTRVVVDTGGSLKAVRRVAMQFADSELADEMAAAIKTRTAEVLAGAADGVDPQEARRAIEAIDAETAAEIGRHLVAGRIQQAEQRLAQATGLDPAEIQRIIAGLESEIDAAIEDSQLIGRLQSALRNQVDDAVRAAAELAGPALSASELRTALDELDAETLRTIAMHLVQGEEERARNVLTANTSLTEEEVDRVVEEVGARFEERIGEWREQAEQAVEAAADYSQMAVWSLFFASLLALLAALFGARSGAGRIRR